MAEFWPTFSDRSLPKQCLQTIRRIVEKWIWNSSWCLKFSRKLQHRNAPAQCACPLPFLGEMMIISMWWFNHKLKMWVYVSGAWGFWLYIHNISYDMIIYLGLNYKVNFHAWTAVRRLGPLIEGHQLCSGHRWPNVYCIHIYIIYSR